MTVCIRIATSPGEAQIAVAEAGRLLDYALWRPGAPDGVGDLHRGRVIAQVPAMAGAFVALAGAEGFLPDSEGAKGLTVGTVLTVRVTRAALGGKGPRLTARVDEAASAAVGGPVALLRRGPDPVARLAARYPEAPVLADDAGAAAGLGRRVSIVRSVFDEDLREAIDALSRPVIELPGGAAVSIWPTPALVAIDVDAGATLANPNRARPSPKGAARGPREVPLNGGAWAHHWTLNRAVLPAVAQQIRLRNLSGGIVVDLAGLSPRKRAALAPDFIAALASDPLQPKFLGFTALGLAEVVRPRFHPPLHELLAGPLAAGVAALRAVLAASGTDPRAMPAIRAHPGVVSALQSDAAALPDLARRTGRAVTLRSDPSLPDTAWVLEKDNG